MSFKTDKVKIKPILIALLFGYFLTIISCSEKTRNISPILDRVSLNNEIIVMDPAQGGFNKLQELYETFVTR